MKSLRLSHLRLVRLLTCCTFLLDGAMSENESQEARVPVVHFCPMCRFEAPTKPLLLNHLRLVHANDPRFSVPCGIEGCTYSAKSFSAFYSHIYRLHKDSGYIERRSSSSQQASTTVLPQLSEGSQQGNSDHDVRWNAEVTDSVRAELEHLLGRDNAEQQRSSATFILKLKETRFLSQAAIDDIVQGWNGIFTHTVQCLEAGVRAKLASAGVEIDSIEGLEGLFADVPNPFDGLGTRYQQEKYFHDMLGLVDPQEIKIGEPYHVSRFSGPKRRLVETHDTYQYVPLLHTLRTLLSDNTVLDEINKCPSRIHSDGTLEDFCDGELFRTHPIFSKDRFALQIIAFYDELELCNPLGTHVLFTLGNIHPKYRSSLRVIHLALAAVVPVIEKYGIDEVLKPFIHDLTTLASTGITITINDQEKTFHGALLAFLADNLGSHAIGGFKESFSFALRICRTCMATKDNYKLSFNSACYECRSDSQYQTQCDMLNGPLRGHYSKTYGINRRSGLIDVPHFPLFSGGLPHDIMHDVLEGVAVREMSLLLNHCVLQRYFSLDEYNSCLSNFDYSHSETDKPSKVTTLTEDRNLRLSASQSLLLIRILPLLVGYKVPEEDSYWKCFLILAKIVDLLMCPVSSKDLCGLLKVLIEEHHSAFKAIYSEKAMTPKFHYLIHYPEQILQTGPMVRSWNMRNEAKLSLFKRASHLGNFKNITFSLASRHQRLLCYELSSDKLLYSPTENGPCQKQAILRSETQDVQRSLSLLLPGISEDASICHLSWIKQDRITVKRSCCYVIIAVNELDPTFARIEDILYIKGEVILLVQHCVTDYYDHHFHAYAIQISPDRSFVCLNELKDHCVLHAHKVSGTLYVYLKWHIA